MTGTRTDTCIGIDAQVTSRWYRSNDIVNFCKYFPCSQAFSLMSADYRVYTHATELGRTRTPYTAMYNGAVSHGAQIGSSPVLAEQRA